MQPHTNYPGLDADFEKLVHQHRRLLAGELRINRERKQLEYDVEAKLRAAGVEAVTVRNNLGTFEVRRQLTRDGRHYASIAPIDAKAMREGTPLEIKAAHARIKGRATPGAVGSSGRRRMRVSDGAGNR